MWWTLVALAEEPAVEPLEEPVHLRFPVTLIAEVQGVAGPGAAGGFGALRVLVNLKPLSLEISGAEGYLGLVDRQAGRIGFGLRREIWHGSYARLAFAHAHESSVDGLMQHPMGTLAGTADHIHHRSGVEIGVGWWFPVAPARTHERLGFAIDVPCQIYPGSLDPVITCGIGLGWGAHVGRPKT